MSRPITLIEMMVVIALIGIASSLFGIKGFRAVQRQRATSHAETFLSRLNLAQRQALASGDEVTVDEVRLGGSNPTTGQIEVGDHYILLPGHCRQLTLSTAPTPEIPHETPPYPSL